MKKYLAFLLIFVSLNALLAQDTTVRWVRHNVKTLETNDYYITYTPSSGTSGYKSANNGVLPTNYSFDISARAFFPQDIINDPNAYPWRTAVKFNDVSGVIIDPYHVLIAHHTVDTGHYFQSVPFFTGYEDYTQPLADQPYRYAYAEYFYWPYDNYKAGGSQDYAIVKLDRPIGVLSGWNGYGYDNLNSNLESFEFYNPSYPSVSPFYGYGSYLYNWKGNFSCIADSFLYSEGRIAYGGMSGSGAFASGPEEFIVYGILLAYTNSPCNYGVNAVKYNRITAPKFDQISRIIDENTPDMFDLMPMKVSVSPQIVKIGNSFESISFVLHNYSKENKTNANISVGIYLSTDTTITTSDQLIHTFYYTKSFTAKSSEMITETNSLPTIYSTNSGANWVGIIITCFDDFNNDNNFTYGIEVAPIVVTNGNYVTIKGRIVSTQANSGVNNVTLSGFPYTTKTDFNGSYETQVTSGWSGTVTPVKNGYDFSNTSTTYTSVTQTTVTDYTAMKRTYTISGNISDSQDPNPQPVPNVILTGLAGDPNTDENGNYYAYVFHNWSGLVIPVKPSYSFNPYYKQYSNLQNANSGQDYTGYYFGDNSTKINNLPKIFKLHINYPNPFNPVTNIKYDLPKDVFVSVKIYDLLGREIKTLVNEYKQAGYHKVEFDGSSFASGVYFYRIQAGNFVSVKKMVLIK
jgi:hypothetical protein